MTNSVLSQNLILPGEGVDGLDIVVNESSIHDVISRYGENYEYKSSKSREWYTYSDLGFKVSCDGYDKKKIVSVVTVFSPYQAQTKEGIVVGQSKWSDLENLYGTVWAQYGGERIYCEKDLITYTIPWDGKKRKVDKDAVIEKISVHKNRDGIGFENQNFELDSARLDSAESFFLDLFQKANTYSSLLQELEANQNMKKAFTIKRYYDHNLSIEHNVKRTDLMFYLYYNRYEVDILSRNDTILYGVINQKDSILSIFYKTPLVTAWIAEHESVYGGTIDVYDPRQFPKERFVYGNACGYSGTPPYMNRVLHKVAEDEEYEKLAKWVRSMNPEIQAYGYDGLLWLSESGIFIREEELKILEHLSGLDVDLYACNGCILYWPTKMSDIVKKKDIKKIRKRNSKINP